MKTANPKIIEILASVGDHELIGVVAVMACNSAPGEPLTVTRLEVLSRRPHPLGPTAA
jgi:hypothetical protein